MTMLTTVSTPATGDAAMRAWLVAALAAGWTVPSSSDGLTYNNSGNQITQDSGAGSFANTGAWARIRQPGGGTRELLVQRGTNSTEWKVSYSVAGFTTGSPGTTTAPTASDQRYLLGSGGGYATLLGTDGGYRWLTAFDNATPYECWTAGLTVGSLGATAGIALLAMASGTCDAADPDPYAAYASGTSVFAFSELWQAESNSYRNFHAWYRYGTGAVAWRGAAFASLAFGQGNIGAEGTIVSLGLTSSFSGAVITLPIICGFRHGNTGIKGQIRGARYTSSTGGSAPNGTHLTDGNSATWVRVGDLWLAWDATVPSL